MKIDSKDSLSFYTLSFRNGLIIDHVTILLAYRELFSSIGLGFMHI